MKDTIDTQRVTTPARQRLAASRKRTLRSRCVSAARSVWSEHLSCVNESRNFVDCQGLPVRVREDNIARNAMAMERAARPGSTSGAEVYWGILGTCEGLPLLGWKYRNGMRPVEQRPGLREVFSLPAAAKQGKKSGYRRSSLRQERRDGEIAGRLSRLIVAFESRETLLGRSL
ncbi:hypothetical protein SCARR_04038 [Pontiella sulfatireligans]|uniref:Uncharacterized protein n=1 Tax=Pontiella sulfatireligans TaxID=2750658 RepID=A0A6C2UP40_9BACT|nr:hypothetical protein SCARR_04038 [Pontiella sulfatireligans]